MDKKLKNLIVKKPTTPMNQIYLRTGVMDNTNVLRCMHANVDCLTNKLKSRLIVLKPDAVAITV